MDDCNTDLGTHLSCSGLSCSGSNCNATICLVQVETTVSNSVLRITGSWIGSSIGFGVMSSSIATSPYGASSLQAIMHTKQ